MGWVFGPLVDTVRNNPPTFLGWTGQQELWVGLHIDQTSRQVCLANPCGH